MGEEFVAVIKLVSGEEILASVCVDETGEEPIIIAHTPVTMKMISNGMYVKIKPWMELADDDMFVFRTDKIITMSEVKDQKVIKMKRILKVVLQIWKYTCMCWGLIYFRTLSNLSQCKCSLILRLRHLDGLSQTHLCKASGT